MSGEPLRPPKASWRPSSSNCCAALPEPVRQHPVRLPDRVVRIDLSYPQVKVMLESDGFTWHEMSRRAWERDLDRQNELVELGWQPLRITKTDIRTRPARTAERVSNLLAARGYRW